MSTKLIIQNIPYINKEDVRNNMELLLTEKKFNGAKSLNFILYRDMFAEENKILKEISATKQIKKTISTKSNNLSKDVALFVKVIETKEKRKSFIKNTNVAFDLSTGDISEIVEEEHDNSLPNALEKGIRDIDHMVGNLHERNSNLVTDNHESINLIRQDIKSQKENI